LISFFADFENALPFKPITIKLSFRLAHRFEKKDIYPAIFLKLARVQSAVRAAYVLLINGYVQYKLLKVAN
jgi:hypothetical protein